MGIFESNLLLLLKGEKQMILQTNQKQMIPPTHQKMNYNRNFCFLSTSIILSAPKLWLSHASTFKSMASEPPEYRKLVLTWPMSISISVNGWESEQVGWCYEKIVQSSQKPLKMGFSTVQDPVMLLFPELCKCAGKINHFHAYKRGVIIS